MTRHTEIQPQSIDIYVILELTVPRILSLGYFKKKWKQIN